MHLADSVTPARAEAWTVTDHAHPLSVPPGVRLILDEAQLSAGLSTDPAQAALALWSRL